jgi:hypothetical protein
VTRYLIERLTLLTRDAAMLGLRLDCIDAG